jgi:hypothetical protein
MMSKTTTESKLRVEYYDWSRWLPALTSIAFAIALAVTIARATTGDFLRNPFDAVPGGEAQPHTSLPNSTIWLDLLAMLPAVLVLLRRGLDRTYVLRFTAAHACIFAFALMAFASALWSADRVAAAVGGFHFIAAAALCWAGTQLVRSWQRLRVIAGLAAAILAVNTINGIYYRTIDLPEVAQNLEKGKERFLAERGWTEDSFAWKQFSQRVAAGEMLGPFSSPNTNAAMIVLLGVIVGALVAQRVRDRDEPIWPTLLALAVVASLYVLYYTGARAAIITPLMAIAIIIFGWRYGSMIAQRRTMLFTIACGAAVFAVVAIIGHGWFHGTLFHDSLTFRWKYWVGSFALFKEHSLLGVGYGNFGYSYLAHRLPEAAEEIKDPHNLFVRAFVELGIVGGLIMIGFIARLAWEVTRPIHPPPPAKSGGTGFGFIVAVAVMAALLSTMVGIDFGRDPGYVATELLRRLVMVGVVLIALALSTIRSSKSTHLDDRPAPLLLIGMIAGVAVFLVHCMIDFALFEAGPMLVFAFVIGSLVGVRGESLAGRKKWNRASIAFAGAGTCAWLIATIAFALPIADAENRAQRGDDLLIAAKPREAATSYKYAFDNCPVSNADYAYRAGRALIIENRDAAETELWLSQAIAANPKDANYRLTRAAFQLSLPAEKQQPRQIIADLETSVALDPMNLQSRTRLAEAYDHFNQRGKAAEQYRMIVELNDKLDKNEPKRLAPTELDRLRALAGPATQPG